MDARTSEHAFETCRVEARRRECPGCGNTIDLSGYGCLRATAVVVCVGCGLEARVEDLDAA